MPQKPRKGVASVLYPVERHGLHMAPWYDQPPGGHPNIPMPVYTRHQDQYWMDTHGGIAPSTRPPEFDERLRRGDSDSRSTTAAEVARTVPHPTAPPPSIFHKILSAFAGESHDPASHPPMKYGRIPHTHKRGR